MRKSMPERLFLESPDPLAWVTPEYTYGIVNHAFAAELGYSPLALQGLAMCDVLGAEKFYDSVFPMFEMARLNGTHNYEWSFPRAGGECIHWAITVRALLTNDDFDGFLVTSRDISNIKDLQRQQENFISSVSHEFRTPLTAITTCLEILEPTVAIPTSRPLLGVMMDACGQLEHLVQGVLDYTKFKSGQYVPNLQPMDLVANIQKTLASYRVAGLHKGLGMESYITGPQVSWVLGDVSLWEQVTLHLLGNAVKFTESGRVEVMLEFGEITERDSLEGPNCTLLLKIADTGTGIQKVKMDKIFDPFFQGESGNNRTFEGLGLGLAIVYRIAEIMQAKIWFEPNLPNGTIVHFQCKARIANESK